MKGLARAAEAQRRCFLPPDRWDDADSVALDGEESRHVCRVWRCRPGDRVTVFDGTGREAVAELLDTDSREARLRLGAPRRHSPPARPVRLGAALLKGQAMDWLIQKATELGAAEVTPLTAARSVARWYGNNDRQRLDRWRRIAREAAKQCSCPFIPPIHPPATPGDFLSQQTEGATLIASLSEPSLSCLSAMRTLPPDGPVTVMIGPEGDWTPSELHAALAAGAQPVRLGPRILRAETAALYLLSVLSCFLE